MLFDVLTLFPEFFKTPLQASLLGKAQQNSLLQVKVNNLRNWAVDKHHRVDDEPYGGGPGMVLKPEPIVAAIEEIQKPNCRRIYFTPQGRPLKQGHLKDYLQYDQLILLCGRYEGVDQRAIDLGIDEEISIGDYVLSGGEAAALVFIEAVSRLIPGVLGKEESLTNESFSPFLEGPQYTRPETFRESRVPEVLLSGNHQEIQKWRNSQAIEKTMKIRPDILKK